MTDSDITFTAAIMTILVIVLAAAVVTDLRSHRIPNILLAPALSLAVLLHTMHGGVDGLIVASGGLALGLVMFLPLYLVGGMGAGDVKLLGVVGSLLGPWGAVVGGMATMMIGAIFGIIVIAWRHIRPVVEVHAIQMLGSSVNGAHSNTDSPASRPREQITYIAYAPAIAAGTVTALWYIGYLPGVGA